MHYFNKLFSTLLVYFIFNNSALAIEIPDSMKSAMAAETAGMPSMLNLVLSMIIVIALIYFTGWIYSKLNLVNKNKLKAALKENDYYKFNILQSMPLGQQRYLYSIEMNDKVLLVASTNSHINLIKEFDKTEYTFKRNDTENIKSNQEETQLKADEQIKKALDIDNLYKKYKI